MEGLKSERMKKDNDNFRGIRNNKLIVLVKQESIFCVI